MSGQKLLVDMYRELSNDSRYVKLEKIDVKLIVADNEKKFYKQKN